VRFCLIKPLIRKLLPILLFSFSCMGFSFSSLSDQLMNSKNCLFMTKVNVSSKSGLVISTQIPTPVGTLKKIDKNTVLFRAYDS